jgi:mannosyltransferase OCH1-like enzyme
MELQIQEVDQQSVPQEPDFPQEQEPEVSQEKEPETFQEEHQEFVEQEPEPVSQEQEPEQEVPQEEEPVGHEEEKQTSYSIPKRIFQTHKSIEYIQTKPTLQKALQSWKQFVPEFAYHFYTDEMCDEFMKNVMVEEFGEEIYEAYKKLPIAVMKADLWRYCIVYKYGGIYSDVDTICLCNPNIFTMYETMLVCAPENHVHLCQWTFAAPAKSPLLKSIIELSITRIMNIPEIKGEHVIHYLTGPAVFTDGIEKYLTENSMTVFANKNEYYRYKNSAMICFLTSRFHNKMIKHLFAGQYTDGWYHERFQRLI